MSLATRQELPPLAKHHASSRPLTVVSVVTALIAGLWDRHARDRHARIIGALDGRQRGDVGIDPVAALPPRPIMTVERGLMSRLMEMR